MKFLLITAMLLVFAGCSSMDTTPPTPQSTALPDKQVQEPIPMPTPLPTETEEPMPSSNPDLQKTADEVTEMVANVAKAAQEYVGKYHEQTQFVSKNGYLSESAGDIYVKPLQLLDITEMDPAYASESVLILYLMPDDVTEFLQIGEGLTPTVFTAYETKDGFIIGNEAKHANVTKEQFHALMNKYDWRHGDVQRYTKDMDVYNSILQALTAVTNEQDIDIRYLAGDEKYASAVISPKSDPLNITEYVLENNGGAWAVAVPAIEKTYWKFAAINKAFPTMDLSIVPKYQLVDTLKFVKNDFQPIIDAMRKEKLIEAEDGDPEFISGDNEFVYMVFPTGKKFLGHNDEEIVTWVMYPVENDEHAALLMQQFAKFVHPPYFLIRQD